MFLSRLTKRTQVVNPSTGGGSTAPAKGGDYVDMSGFQSCAFIALLGSGTASTKTVAMKVQGSTAAAGTYKDLTGCSVQTAASFSAGTLQVDVNKPTLGDAGNQYRYVRPYLTVTSTVCIVGGVIAEQYAARSLPVAQPTSSIANSTGDAKCVVSPGSTT